MAKRLTQQAEQRRYGVPEKIIATAPVDTAAGVFVAAYTRRGLARLEFPPRRKRKQTSARGLPHPLAGWHLRLADAVRRVLRGQRQGSLPPLDLSSGTPFQQAVWRALRRIPRGRTCTYREVASRVRRPRAVRAVGQACGANPIPLLIPCHRVRATGGGLGGFSAGLDWKRRLLEVEKALE